jgi:hypothetical protein
VSGSKLAWQRLLGEAFVIVISVYLAIFLQERADDRERTEEAIDALVQLREELRSDRSDLLEVLAEQRQIDLRYARVDQWLSARDGAPTDSLTAALDSLAYSNRTMFPRKSAWTTMVASGQLRYLGDPGLVVRLANLYENANPRLEYNGRLYDEENIDVLGSAAPLAWDAERGAFPSDDPRAIDGLRNRLRYVHLSQTRWYIQYLEEYGEQLEARLAEVNAYLATQGRSDA